MRLAIIAPALALRAGLRALLAGAGSIVVESPVIEAASLAEYAAAGAPADVLLVAGEALDADGLRACLDGEDAGPGILALSDRPESAAWLASLPLNGWGVLPLDVSAEELQAGLRAVAAGLAVVTPALYRAARGAPRRAGGALQDPEAFTLDEGQAEALTERESQVLQHLARGLANKQIALALGISEHTVKFHVSAIYAKLGAANRTEAVRAGVRRGLIIL